MHPARPAALLAIVALSITRPCAAQCVIEGQLRVRSLPRSTASLLDAMPIEQRARGTIRGSVATVEGRGPLAFERAVAASQLALFIGPWGFASALLSAAPGARVTVESAHGGEAIVALRSQDDADGIELRGVRVPCSALSAAPERAPRRAGEPPFARNPRWQSESDASARWACTRVGGASGCAPVRSGCVAVGDGSACGFHPRERALRMYAAPDARSTFIDVRFTEDVALRDDDGRPGWLRLSSRGQRSDGIIVRGWVRRERVRFAQAVPHWLARSEVGAITGTRTTLRARAGFVLLAPGTIVRDALGSPWARVIEPWCTRALQPLRSARVQLVLPGASDEDDDANVESAAAPWVDACPAAL